MYLCVCKYMSAHICTHTHTLKLNCDCSLSQNIICGNETGERRELLKIDRKYLLTLIQKWLKSMLVFS